MSAFKIFPPRAIDSAVNVRFKIIMRLLLAATLAALPASTVAKQNEKLVVLPFEIVDNTPVPGGVERNERMLERLTNFISQKINEMGIFDVVAQNEIYEMVNAAELGTYIRTCNRCEYDLAKKVEGDKVLTGWIYKMSILVLTMHIEVKDVATERTLISKAYDFRGDNEQAWLRAASYMLRDLEAMIGE
ncbi:MAG: DUF3280 domain-containing protein [Candidatus Thiodiazotropha sp. (ex Ctena orbiculata)]|nr:DUF3280 domain-containing protein [Candidatus Thiodiazotropha taylori]MBT2996547.1 DUF3280 domain-containing protein [Candidatus Thiodiazotropha taylori]MBT3000587.1 DUF3280 domain-containing protein [Candidatus Thiodiazotropha taylori]MBV2106916.1 DUF3280 domain-containing protein [Candidatus Thiodiazotropha taylori]MBV2111146.1 DUF3280 domain-containing protein [Candidatus Thiodiazotropha taylori]